MRPYALLKTDEEGHASVAANQHVYTVDEDGFVLVDVRPYLATDPGADAERDAREICAIHHLEGDFGIYQKVRVYSPATKAQAAAWQANPANEARITGETPEAVEKARKAAEAVAKNAAMKQAVADKEAKAAAAAIQDAAAA